MRAVTALSRPNKRFLRDAIQEIISFRHDCVTMMEEQNKMQIILNKLFLLLFEPFSSTLAFAVQFSLDVNIYEFKLLS